MIDPVKYSILFKQLTHYTAQELCPFHMPGHKRQTDSSRLPYGIDVTEVPGTDDLHDADGILKEAMERTAKLYGADRTWYLVGGSTAGNLAGLSAIAPKGSEVIIARNCHRSVFHAAQLRELTVHWAVPEMAEEYGMQGSMDPETIRRLLEIYPDTGAVVLTSPTYEGVVSDIRRIAAICHKKGIPLMVDEAHGAHLGFGHGFPESSVHCGADVSVQSFHKTLPSLTQTAVLHLKGNLVSPRAIGRWLDVYETSSPSYPLMVSIDAASGLMREKGDELLEEWRKRLDLFRKRAAALQSLRVPGAEELSGAACFGLDPGKIIIDGRKAGLTGLELADRLRDVYGIETEMSMGSYVLAMTGMTDSEEFYRKLEDALRKIDRWAEEASASHRQPELCQAEMSSEPPAFPEPGRAVFPLGEAADIPEVCRAGIGFAHSAGEVALEYVYAYPPGIPFLIPGETITEDAVRYAQWLRYAGFRLHFTESGDDSDKIQVYQS